MGFIGPPGGIESGPPLPLAVVEEPEPVRPEGLTRPLLPLVEDYEMTKIAREKICCGQVRWTHLEIRGQTHLACMASSGDRGSDACGLVSLRLIAGNNVNEKVEVVRL